MHKEIGCENPLANVQIGKLRAHLNVLIVTFQSDPQFSWKLLNYQITLALLVSAVSVASQNDLKIQLRITCCRRAEEYKDEEIRSEVSTSPAGNIDREQHRKFLSSKNIYQIIVYMRARMCRISNPFNFNIQSDIDIIRPDNFHNE